MTTTPAVDARSDTDATRDGIDAATRAVAADAGIPASALERRESHLSVVLLTDEKAYRVRRPVAVGDIHLLTAHERLAAARAEMQAHQLTAPLTYLGIRAVVPYGDGFVLGDAEDPAAVEYVVVMRRFRREETLVGQMRHTPIASETIEEIGRLLALRHGRTATATMPPTNAGQAAAHACRSLDRTADDLLALLEHRDERFLVTTVHRRLRAYVRRNDELFAVRAAAGLLRESSGDLRADRVLVYGDGASVCVELLAGGDAADADLVPVDVAADLAALETDLLARGDARLADRIAAAYRHCGGDPGDPELRAYFGAHRALERARRSALLLEGPEAEVRVRALLALAERQAWQTLPLQIVVVCGVPASGKTHLAHLLAARTGWPVVRSEAARRTLSGVAAQPADLYMNLVTDTAYEELGREAAALAGEGHRVIVDGSCCTRRSRDALRDGFANPTHHARFVECRVPVEVLAQRLARRTDGAPHSAGEGLADVEPLDDVPAREHIVLRTDRRAQDALAQLSAVLDG